VSQIIYSIIRITISVILCFLIFTEAGIWTAIFAVLMLIYCEFNNYMYSVLLNNVLMNRNSIKTLQTKI